MNNVPKKCWRQKQMLKTFFMFLIPWSRFIMLFIAPKACMKQKSQNEAPWPKVSKSYSINLRWAYGNTCAKLSAVSSVLRLKDIICCFHRLSLHFCQHWLEADTSLPISMGLYSVKVLLLVSCPILAMMQHLLVHVILKCPGIAVGPFQ